LSPGKRRPKQNLSFSRENETFLFEPGSEYTQSVYSTDNDGRTQLTRMLGGDKHLSHKIKAHIERKVDEEAAARFEKMSIKEKLRAQRLGAQGTSRKNKSKKSKRGKGDSTSFSSDEESQASLGELLKQVGIGTGKKYGDESTQGNSSGNLSDRSSSVEEEEEEEEEETEYTVGTMTLIEKADKLAKLTKKKKNKRHSTIPKGCKKVKCPPGRLGISIDTTSHGPAIGYIAPKSALVGLVEVGDIILKIDRKDVTHLDAEDVSDMLLERKDHYRKLIIQV